MFVCCVLLISGCGGYEIESETEKLYMRGKVITFKTDMNYMKCDGEHYTVLEKSLFLLVEEEFIDLYQRKCSLMTPGGIKKKMRFEVIDSFLKKPWGFYKPFNHIIRFLVLQDEDGRRSMYLESFLYNSSAKIS